MNSDISTNRFTNNNQSTDKVLAIMELLSFSNEPLRLLDIANELNYNSSTALRFLNSLEQNGYVYKNPDTLKYQMTYKLCGLANHISSNSDLVGMASGPIKSLSMELGECVCLAIEQDYSVIYIYVADGPGQMLRTTHRIGYQAPMHCTGVGKVLLSDFPQYRLEEFFAAKELTSYTCNTITTKDGLLKELENIRRLGYAYDNEECELGARCISFPIRNYTNGIIASMSVTGPAARMSDEYISDRMQTMLETATSISGKLGYRL